MSQKHLPVLIKKKEYAGELRSLVFRRKVELCMIYVLFLPYDFDDITLVVTEEISQMSKVAFQNAHCKVRSGKEHSQS
jgi:hypothetical protein